MTGELSVFLLAGQSNMLGRGKLDEVPTVSDRRVLMFRDGCWVPGAEPLHPNRPGLGIGPGMSFAIKLADMLPGPAVGLVPCAVGGTALKRWMPGADLYEQALSTTLRALSGKDRVLRGILWHQGENDSMDEDSSSSYGARLEKMIRLLRHELPGKDIPFVAGELGHFLEKREGYPFFKQVNRQLSELADRIPAYGCVSAKGLADKGDLIHFDSKSAREYGLRYAAKYLEIARRPR